MTIKLLSAALFAIVIALATSQAWAAATIGSAAKSKPVSIDYVAGKKAADAGDYETAVENLKKAVATDPSSADAYNLLGYSYRKLGDTDAAFENYQTALRLNRMHRGANEYLGELYLEMGNVAEAKKLMQALGKYCTYFLCRVQGAQGRDRQLHGRSWRLKVLPSIRQRRTYAQRELSGCRLMAEAVL